MVTSMYRKLSNRTFYHTSIHQKNIDRTLYELDSLNQDEIIEKVIMRYMRNERIHFDGYFIEPESVDRIVIKQSAISSKEFVDTVNYERALKSPTATLLGRTDIMNDLYYATDITKILFALAEDKLREEVHTKYKDSNGVIHSNGIIHSHGFKVSNSVIASNDKASNDKASNDKVSNDKASNDKVSNNKISKDESEIDRTKVFIVHGHDDLAKTQASEFVRKLGLTPIILHQQASGGKTIIEKIESYSNVGFGIVLYTPCDLGSKVGEEKHLSPRARQNVVFEHGFLIGKIGRENVAALVKNTVETPNDISGVVYIPMKSEGNWELQLAKELKSSGYDIDLNKLYN
ncbi:TIR domain-containing protein [Bacillus paramycoides]|uniref:TIR domain-containing protein n=1 Tax=Bacillus paramycoides TaxID=2026194 RepID=UPI002E1C1413|nr:TIR domain-containing protein [Bacillus paramycoides]MED0983716.1 nucleotide-binding protein [Bacillus paramycoides]